MLGAYIAFNMINWNAMDRIYGNPNTKIMNLFFIIFIVMINLSVGLSNPQIDNLGHLGGLLYGFFLAFLIITPLEENDGVCCGNKIWLWSSCLVLFVLYIVLGLIFFFVVKFPPGQQSTTISSMLLKVGKLR